MYVPELEEIGLTPREIKVYTSLLEIGLSSVGQIIRKSGIPSSKIYETLDKLKKRGLVSSVMKENRQFFMASDPRVILDYIDEQHRKMSEAVLPKLEILQKKVKKEREATIYEGIRGIKSIYERMLRTLDPGKTLYVLGVSLKAQEKLEPYILRFNKRRIRAGIRMKIIYHEDARKYGEIRKKMRLTEVRYMKKELITPAWIDIFSDQVVIFDFEDTPIGILIRDENVAQNFKSYFNIIWGLSKAV